MAEIPGKRVLCPIKAPDTPHKETAKKIITDTFAGQFNKGIIDRIKIPTSSANRTNPCLAWCKANLLSFLKTRLKMHKSEIYEIDAKNRPRRIS